MFETIRRIKRATGHGAGKVQPLSAGKGALGRSYSMFKRVPSSRRRLMLLASRFLSDTARLRVLGLPSGIEEAGKFPLAPIYEQAPVTVTVPAPIERQFKQNYAGQYFPERVYPSCYVMRVESGISSYSGFTISSAGKLIPEGCFEIGQRQAHEYSILRRPKLLPTIVYAAEPVVTLTSPWQSNYFHWLFDILPRLHLLERAGIGCKRLYVEQRTGFQRQSLAFLGYHPAQIIDAARADFVSAPELIVPSLPGVPGIMPPWACDFLREKFHVDDDATRPGNRLIYVSRADASKRQIANEDALVVLLRELGFTIVRLDGMSVFEQVQLFRQARTVIGAHGAGLANLVFCGKSTRVIELFSPAWVNACYFDLSQQVGLNYDYLIGEDVAPQGADCCGGKPTTDIQVDLDALEELINTL